ncbi:MAG: M28 family peptidase [Gemmatimonadota bacterium]
MRPSRLAHIAACFLAAAASASAQPSRTLAPKPTSAQITREDVMTRTYIIADDSMEGRDTGKRGGLRSARYIAGELQRLGLRPGGDSGTFLQQIPWVARTPDTLSVLRTGTTTFTWNRDFLVIPKIGFALAIGGQPFGGGFDGTNVPTVFGGRIGDSAIAPADVQGKVVVFAPPANGPSFTFWQRDNLRRYAGARAIFVATLDLGAPAAYRATRETYWDPTGSAGLPPMTVIAVSRATGASIFGRPLDSVAVRSTGAPLSGHAGFIDTPTEAPAYNVVGILPGSDAKLATTYVAVGAHHDHVGMGPPVDHDSIRAFNQVVRTRGADDPQPRSVTAEQTQRIRLLLDSLHAAHGVRRDSIFNGADDDGSGSVLALEIAEYYARATTRPKRSLVFVFHTAEERGLYGAQFFSDHPTVPRDSIVAQTNMDQMGRGEAIDNQPGGANALVLIGTRRLSTELGDMVEAVNARTAAPFALDYSFDKNGDPTNAYCRSDHYMYARFGIPVAFFSAAAWHIDYHMVSDEPQYVQYDRMAKIGRYIADVVGDVANLTHRPVVDKSRPDPNAMCRQ